MGNRFRFVIITCLWLAFLLRVWGLDFGLPYEFHPDEHQYVDEALNWYTNGEMRVRIANPPLFTYLLVTAFSYWMTLSPFDPTSEWLTTTYTFARFWSVSLAMLTVALMYPLGKRLHHRKIGLLGIILLTGLFLPAREAHFAVNDATVTFFSLLVVYFSLKIFKPGGTKYYLFAGLAVGIATATKLTAVLTCFVLFGAHIFSLTTAPNFTTRILVKPQTHRRLIIGLLAAVAVFLLISLQLFWRFSEVVAEALDLVELGVRSARGGVLMGPASGWHFYFNVLGWGIGWTMLITALVVLAFVFVKRWPEGIIVSILPIMLFVFLGAQKLFTARYLLPAIPPLVLLVAVGLVQLETHWSFFKRHRFVLWPLMVVLLVGQPLANLIWFDHLLTLPNTQQIATAWFAQNFPHNTVVAKEAYSVLPNFVFVDKQWPYKVIALDSADQTHNDVNHYVAHKTQIIAVSNYRYARVRREPEAEERRRRQLAFLAEKAILIKEFNPYRQSAYDEWFYQDQLYGPAGETWQRLLPGPLIEIYELPYESQPYSLEKPEFAMPVNANFDNKIVLLGYDLPSRKVDAGGNLPLTLYWQPLTRLTETYVIFNHLLDNRQQNWGGYDRWPQETSNTTLWRPNEIIVDAFNLPVSTVAPDGVYTVDIGLYSQADPAATPLPLWQDGDSIEQNSIRIGPVKVGGPPPEIVDSSAEVAVQMPLSVEMGQPPVILLRGYDLNPDAGRLSLTLYWESLAPTSVDWSIFVHLRNEAGQIVAQKDGPAGASTHYPTSLWDPGEIIADEIVISLPSELSSGKLSLVVGLYNLQDGARLAVPNNPNYEILLTSWKPTGP